MNCYNQVMTMKTIRDTGSYINDMALLLLLLCTCIIRNMQLLLKGKYIRIEAPISVL